MALFKTCRVVDANGKETVKSSGPFSDVEMKSEGNTTCIKRTDVFGYHEEQTCVVTPNTIVKNG